MGSHYLYGNIGLGYLLEYFFARFTEFNVYAVGGATASGLQNPKSKTGAFDIFSTALAESTANMSILILGEVDTGFVIWYRAKKYGDSIDKMMNQALCNYKNLITQVAGKMRKVIVVSTPLPTIPDGNQKGEVADLRKGITASQYERTELTLLFNKEIKSFCEKTGVRYVDLDEKSIGANGVVKNSLLNKDETDHHYSNEKYITMLRKNIWI